MNLHTQLESHLFDVFHHAILTVGIEQFKRTSLFGSNDRSTQREQKLAA